MRYIRVSADTDADRFVSWSLVDTIQYVYEGSKQYITLTYRNGARKFLSPPDALDLYHKVRDTRGCPAPCYYRQECDSAPDGCTQCKLAEALDGLEVEVRPAPVRRRQRQADVRGWVIAALLVLVVLLIATADAARQSPLPRSAGVGKSSPPGARARIQGSRGREKGRE